MKIGAAHVAFALAAGLASAPPVTADAPAPVRVHRVAVPDAALATEAVDGEELTCGGDVRIGDLTGDGRCDILVYRSTGGGMKPCFLAAFDLDGELLWRVGEGGGQPARPGSVCVHDADGDGRAEVYCFFRDPGAPRAPNRSLADVRLEVRDGRTGRLIRRAAPGQLRRRSGRGANWVHQRILAADLRGLGRARDFVVKLGDTVLAFTDELKVLWTYRIRWNEYGKCSAYTPAVGDIDGDGRDEVNGGYYLLDPNGRPRWEKRLGPHMDSVVIHPWDEGTPRAICSGAGCVVAADGAVLIRLGEQVVPHGQEVRVARFTDAHPAPQMLLRYRGHGRHVMLVDVEGRVARRWVINSSPNQTGMTEVYWLGRDRPAAVCNGGVLWTGLGERIAALPGLGEPVGPSRMGWYHCIPADLNGDGREEMVIYNPWDRFVSVYAAPGYEPGRFVPSLRAANPRIMD